MIFHSLSEGDIGSGSNRSVPPASSSDSASGAVQIITTAADSLSQDLCESHIGRLESRGGVFTADQLTPVYCAALVGCGNDEDQYSNLLFGIRDDLIRADKLVIFKDTKFDNPMNNEVIRFGGIDRSSRVKIISGLCARIEIPCSSEKTELARRALNDMLSSSNDPDGVLYNKGVKLASWFSRCIGSSPEFRTGLRQIPIIIYYGMITPLEVMLLHLLSCSGFDVLYICPDKSCLTVLKENNFRDRMQIFELENSKPVMPYPDKEVRTKVATVAYNAERELDTVLYGGDTMFRDFQFSDMEAAVLKTTYDEIDVLWNEFARFRTGFSVKGQRVVVPTIFAKISGIRDGNVNAYWDEVRDKLTPNTILTVKSPAYRAPDKSMLRKYDPYHDGHHLFVGKLKQSPMNPYGFLSDELQLLILNKIQEAFDSGYLMIDDREKMQQLIFAGLNLDRNVLRILQKYDFTKEIPKFIVIDTIEDTFSIMECTQLVLLGMLGFDILIYTPTGYRDLETFISPTAYELHQMNEYKYNLSVPKFKIPDKVQPKKGGLFQNLFRKGRR